MSSRLNTVPNDQIVDNIFVYNITKSYFDITQKLTSSFVR